MNHDEILETAAREIEEPSLMDRAGMLSRTKRGRREYELRNSAALKERERCAGIVRAMMSGRGLDPITTLRRIAELPADSRQHDLYLVQAWPLAWKGWLNIECRICCNSNGIPPRASYIITLTDEGRAAMERSECPGPSPLAVNQ